MYFFGFVDRSKIINIFYFTFWTEVYKYDKFRTVLKVEKYIHPGGVGYITPPDFSKFLNIFIVLLEHKC